MAVGGLNPCDAPSNDATKGARTKKFGDTDRHSGSDTERRERASYYRENKKNSVTITLLKAKEEHLGIYHLLHLCPCPTALRDFLKMTKYRRQDPLT